MNPDIISAIAFLYVTVIAVQSGLRIAKGFLNPIHMIIGITYIFCGLPLLMDVFDWGISIYGRFPRFMEAIQNDQIQMIYAGYMVFAFSLLWFLRPGRKDENRGIKPQAAHLFGVDPFMRKGYLRSGAMALCIGFTLLPFALVAASPDRFAYIHYAAATKGLLSYSGMMYHGQIGHAVKLALLGIIGILYLQPKLTWGKLAFVIPYFLAIFWLHGKRTIIAMGVVMLFGLIVAKFKLTRKMILALISVTTIAMLGYTVLYQMQVRDAEGSFSDKVRIDFTRDDVIKMAILAETSDEYKILEYRGESMLFHMFTFIPRDSWGNTPVAKLPIIPTGYRTEKPLPYAQYVTSAIFKSAPRLWGWGMTTSIYDEMIANFSWFGMLIAPSLLLLICHLGYNPGNPLFNIYTGLVGSLLVVLHPTPTMPMLYAWIVGVTYFTIFRVKKIGRHPHRMPYGRPRPMPPYRRAPAPIRNRDN